MRAFLRKTWLPLKRKKDALLGRIRLSMSYRITLNYLKLLVINGVIFMAAFLLLYMNSRMEEYQELADQMMPSIYRVADKADEDKTPAAGYDAAVNPYLDRGIRVMVRQKESGRVLYDDTDLKVRGFLFFQNLHIDLSSDTHKLVTQCSQQFSWCGKEYEANFLYNLTKEYRRMWRLVLNMVLLYAFIVYFILREARSQNQKMLAPIQEMSDTVNRITVNNLHSERLNVKGVKDELKDLAETFNDSLDRLETSYESQKQFVSDASHELRTPIAVVQGYANMLKRWGSRDEAVLAESVEAISNEAAQMQDLVEKLLFLSRHDKKTLKLKKEYFNMRPVVEEMVKETKLVTANRVIEAPALEDVRVYGDKQAIKQAIRVFIDNAQKYTEDGDTIRISCENKNGDCMITVTDTGIGMQRKDLDNIFSRFYRADDVRNKKIEGHGLGLSIAKLIIMAHTGRIKIRTQYTKGTSFIVTLPKVR